MTVNRKDVVHLMLGLLFLLFMGLFVRHAIGVVATIPAVNLSATPGAGRVTLQWSIPEAQGATATTDRRWQYRRVLVDARAQGDACGAPWPWTWTRRPGEEAWQSIEPSARADTAVTSGEQSSSTAAPVTMNHEVTGLKNGRIYAFCVRESGQRPNAYSQEVLVAVPAVSAARLHLIEDRLGALEAKHLDPCGGQITVELGTLHFDADSSTLPPSDPELSKRNTAAWATLRRKMHGRSGGRLLVSAYASSDYPASYNLDLSERRAESVVASLRQTLGNDRRFLAAFFGEQHDVLKSRRDDPGDRRVRIHWCKDAG